MTGNQIVAGLKFFSTKLRRIIFGLLVLAGLMLVLGLGVVRNPSVLPPQVVQMLGPWAKFAEDPNWRIVAVHKHGDAGVSFVRGAQMAVDNINGRNGGVAGRQVALMPIEEQAGTIGQSGEVEVSKALKLSEKIAKLPNVLAVIGHSHSVSAVTASAVYDRNDLLYLSTHATETSLTNHKLDTVLALVPNIASYGRMVAQYATESNLKQFVVLSDKTNYGREAVKFFVDAVALLGGEVVYRGHVDSDHRSVEQLMLYLLDNKSFDIADVDAVFIVTSNADDTVDFIKTAHQLSLGKPIMGLDYLFDTYLTTLVGLDAMKDVIGVSLLDVDSTENIALEFKQDFESQFNTLPDLSAAIAYDSVKLVSDAVSRHGETNGKDLADTIKVARYTDRFSGITGELVFDATGAIVDTNAFIVRHDGKKFTTVKTFSIPVPQPSLPGRGTP